MRWWGWVAVELVIMLFALNSYIESDKTYRYITCLITQHITFLIAYGIVVLLITANL